MLNIVRQETSHIAHKQNINRGGYERAKTQGVGLGRDKNPASRSHSRSALSRYKKNINVCGQTKDVKVAEFIRTVLTYTVNGFQRMFFK